MTYDFKPSQNYSRQCVTFLKEFFTYAAIKIVHSVDNLLLSLIQMNNGVQLNFNRNKKCISELNKISPKAFKNGTTDSEEHS